MINTTTTNFCTIICVLSNALVEEFMFISEMISNNERMAQQISLNITNNKHNEYYK